MGEIQWHRKKDRWREKKGQCDKADREEDRGNRKAERERERETDGSGEEADRNLLGQPARHNREYGKPKNVSRKGRRRTARGRAEQDRA